MNVLIIGASMALGALWGSFLNVVAVRLLAGSSLIERSRCPACSTLLSWYELIPIYAWIRLWGSCAHCAAPISWWYPLIESITACWFCALAWAHLTVQMPLSSLLVLMLFGSALIITIRTDGEQLLILRLCTVGILPLLLGCAYGNLLAVTWYESILGLISGIVLLGGIRWLFWQIRGYEGLGLGDVELIGAIGCCVGPVGVWVTIMIAASSGTLYAGILMLRNRASHATPIPFGLFLSIAGLLVALLQSCGYLTIIL